MGVDEMIWGRLTDKMLVEEGGSISKADYVHPRCEPEIAFLLKKPLAGRVTALQAQTAIEAIAPAIEVIDSRYEDLYGIFLWARSDTIYAGTNQIQRNIIAQRALGLPR